MALLISVDKIKSTLSSGSSKVTGVFKSKSGGGGALQKLSNSNTHHESAVFSEPSLSLTQLILYGLTMFFTFLAICTMAAVAAFQAKWIKISGGTGFSLFLVLFGFLLSTFLLVVPLIYDRFNRCKRVAQFLSQARSAVILNAFGTLIIGIATFIVTISAWGGKGCKNPDNDPNADKGDDYKNGLKGWCRTKRASSIFDWFALAAWAALLVLSAISFRNERRTRREPSFNPPGSPGGYGDERLDYGQGQAYSQVGADDVFDDKHEEPVGAPRPQAYSRPPIPLAHDSAMARPSVDAYGAFDGDMPGAVHSPRSDGASRTMQLAYDDPYAQVRASVLSDVGYAPQQPVNPPYAPQGYPAPAAGYRGYP